MLAEGLTSISDLTERVLHDPAWLDGCWRRSRSTSARCSAIRRSTASFREKLVPILRTYPFVRIWHAGCSTGEEVYSTAILLHEAGLYDRCRIYATDINEAVLRKARDGIFPLTAMKAYTANYIQAGGTSAFSEYYTAQYDSAIFRPWLRRNLVFAQHNLAMDTSFNELHVIVCRNVMIYFNRTLQSRVARPVLGQPGAARVPLPGQQGVAEGDARRGRLRRRGRRRANLPEGARVIDGLVVVGASFGGFDALKVVLGALPAAFPVPLAIVQHQGSPGTGLAAPAPTIHGAGRSWMPRTRTSCCPGVAYLAPPGYHLLVERGSLALSIDPPVIARPPLDRRPVRVGRRRLRPRVDRRHPDRHRAGWRGRARPDQAAWRPGDRAGPGDGDCGRPCRRRPWRAPPSTGFSRSNRSGQLARGARTGRPAQRVTGTPARGTRVTLDEDLTWQWTPTP